LSTIHRSKIDFNRPARSSDAFEQSSKKAKRIHKFYHKKILRFYNKCVSKFGKCLVIDLHGFTKPQKEYPDIIIGNIFGKTLKIANNPKTSDYWGFSDVVQELSKNFSLDDGLGLTSFNFAYSGGYITHRFYKKKNVNAFQIEVAKYIRRNSNLTSIFINHMVNAIINSLNQISNNIN
jgi:N-formylglutamate amidohydrolase